MAAPTSPHITRKRVADDDDDDDDIVVDAAVNGRVGPSRKRPCRRRDSPVDRIVTITGVARDPDTSEASYVAKVDELLCKGIVRVIRNFADYDAGSWVLPQTAQVALVIGLRMAMAEAYPVPAKLDKWIAKYFHVFNDAHDAVLPGAKERIPGEGVGAFSPLPRVELDDDDEQQQ